MNENFTILYEELEKIFIQYSLKEITEKLLDECKLQHLRSLNGWPFGPGNKVIIFSNISSIPSPVFPEQGTACLLYTSPSPRD